MRAAILALALLAPLAAQAQETRLRLGDAATVRRAPEEAFATLRAESRAATAATAQAAVNRAVTAAMEQAGRVPNLRATTARYSTHRVEDPRGWLATQSITLRGGEAALADLAGTLQSQGLLLEGIGATLSESARREARDEATRLAIRALRARAELVAGELGLRVSHLAEIAVDAELPEARPAAAPMAMRAAAAPPASAPEDVAVHARVSADVILLPR